MKTAPALLPLLFLACAAVAGCSLKDKLLKADEAVAAAEPVAPASTAVDPSAPAASSTASSEPPAATGEAPAVKSAAKVAAATGRYPVVTCPKGQVPGTLAMSPLKAFCGARCKTDADCKGVYCMEVNDLTPNAPEQYIKLCDPYEVKEKETAPVKPSAAASGKPAAGTKCGPNEHFDDINKKCLPFGECPDGYRWNDPMKSCVDDG